MRRGWIETFDELRLFGFVMDQEDGRRYFFHLRDVRLDHLLRQKATCIVGTAVKFGLLNNSSSSHTPRVAYLEPETEEQTVSLDDHREISTVKQWDHRRGVGFLFRECGDELAFRRENIVSDGEWSLLPGSQLYHGVARLQPETKTDGVEKLFKHVDVTNIEIVDGPAVDVPSIARPAPVKSRGTVISYDPNKFGFIANDAGGPHIFFPAGSVGFSLEECQSVLVGSKVQFELCHGAGDRLIRKLNRDFQAGRITEAEYFQRLDAVKDKTHAEKVRPIVDSWPPADLIKLADSLRNA